MFWIFADGAGAVNLTEVVAAATVVVAKVTEVE
jgi:hypothetical protein